MPLLYVCCPEQCFSRNRYLTVGLAPPDSARSARGRAAAAGSAGRLCVLAAPPNTAGAIGDLCVGSLILQSPSWVHFRDAGVGISAWAPPEPCAEAAGRRRPLGLD